MAGGFGDDTYVTSGKAVAAVQASGVNGMIRRSFSPETWSQGGADGNFQQLVNDPQARGYNIDSLGSYRNIAGTDKLSNQVWPSRKDAFSLAGC